MCEGLKLVLVLTSILFLGQPCRTQGHEDVTLQMHYTSTYVRLCSDDCRLNKNYFWCPTDQGWDYCSPKHNVTYTAEPCRSDHWCDNHGYSYYWCWTDSSWGYCGLIETFTNRRQKRHPNDIIEICTVYDKHNKKVIKLTAQPATNDIMDARKWKNDINNIILLWDKISLGDKAKSNILKTDKFRIDLQHMVKRNNQHYYNLQIQLNVRRNQKWSTTVAQVLTPKDQTILDIYIQRAFTESFQRRARVFVDVSDGNVPDKLGQNCDSIQPTQVQPDSLNKRLSI